MTIRPAHHGDAVPLQELLARAGLSYPLPSCGPRDTHEVVLVAEGEQGLVGYVSGALNGHYAGPGQAPPPPHAYLLVVVVDPFEQRQGVGRNLVSAFLDQARALGVGWSFLFPDEGPGADERVTFFGRLGYLPLEEPGELYPAMGRTV